MTKIDRRQFAASSATLLLVSGVSDKALAAEGLPAGPAPTGCASYGDPGRPHTGRPIMPPWSVIDDFPLLQDEKDLRIRNRATVEKYLSMVGLTRLDRWKLNADLSSAMADGFLKVTPDGRQPTVQPKDREGQIASAKFNAETWPDWRFYNNIIFETEDPGLIIVEGDGSGMSYLKDKTCPNWHGDHYIHVFRLKNGRITGYTEVRNELSEIREWGITPSLPRFANYEAMYEAEAKGDEPYACTYRDDPAERARNSATALAYLACSGKSCADRWQLFAQDGSSGPGYTGDGRILRARGIDRIRKAEALRARCFPDWRYSGTVLHQTTDPTYFLCETDGEGTCIGYADKPFHYREHLYYSFRMREGKIVDVREYADPQKWAQLTGWDMRLPRLPFIPA